MITTVFSGSLLVTVYLTRNRLDAWLSEKTLTLRRRKVSNEELALPWLNHLSRYIRTGGTLSEALQSFAKAHRSNPYAKESLNILTAQPSKNPLARFVSESIHSGGSVLGPFQFFRRQLEQRIRSQRKARALTAQARLQAAVIFFAPWGLLASLSISDPEMATLAVKDPLCLGIWITALAMSFIGMSWIHHLLKTAITPTDQDTVISENFLPDFLLHLFARVAAGNPVEEAAKKSIFPEAPEIFSILFSDISNPNKPSGPLFLLDVRETLGSAAVRGSPLKDEIQRILDDCESHRDTRIEEALQKLPVKILAPLFCCILPAALLILFSFLLPVFRQWG